MELRTLRYFLSIAQEGSMTAAAELLHISQPALSRQMTELEQELNIALFYRSGRKLTLTEEGLFLRQKAQAIVDLADRTELAFRSPEGGSVVGELVIGAGETPLMELVARCIHRVRQRYPAIRFHLDSGTADRLVQRMNQGLIDFGLLFEPVDKEKLEFIPVPLRDEIGVLVREDGPYGRMSAVTPEVLEQMPLLIGRRSEQNDVLSFWLGKSVGKLNALGTYRLIQNAIPLAKAGTTNILSLRGLVNTKGTGLRYLPLLPKAEMSLIFAWKKYQKMSKAGQIFLAAAREEISAQKPISTD